MVRIFCEAGRRGLRRFASAALAVLLVAGCNLSRADTAYWRVTVDRVTVVADSSAQRCSKLAAQFLAFEGTLRGLAAWGPDFTLPPVAVYSLSPQDAQRVLLSDGDRQRQRASGTTIYSKYLPGRDFNITAVVDENGSDDPLQSVLLLYAEGMLTSGPTQRYPPWYQLGIANLLNGLMIRSDGSVLLNRSLPFEPSMEGRAQAHYDLAKVLGITVEDLNAGADFKEFVHRAREWAQFGLLTTEERRSHYRELATVIRQGEPVAEAVKDVFGVPLEELARELEAGQWKKDVQFRLDAPKGLPVVPTPVKLDAAEANTLLQVVAARASRERPERM